MQLAAQEAGVNDFYEEIFKHWQLKPGKPASSSSLGSEIIELEDSGDEAGDLSIIMQIKTKEEVVAIDSEDISAATMDPYAMDVCEETGLMSSELRDYTESTLQVLNDAMEAEAQAEADASEVYLYPEYPEVGERMDEAKPSGNEPGDRQEKPVMPAVEVDESLKQDPQPAAALEVASHGTVHKGYKKIEPDSCTVKDVEERIRVLQHHGGKLDNFFFVWTGTWLQKNNVVSCIVGMFLRQLLLQKRQQQQKPPATDFADTLPFEPSPVAATLKRTLSAAEMIDSQDSSPPQSSPDTGHICRSLQNEFSEVKPGMGCKMLQKSRPI